MASNTANVQDKITEISKTSVQRGTENGARIAGVAQEGAERINDLRERTAENARQFVQTSLEAASHQAREVSERFSRSFGIGGEDTQHLAEQSKQNLEAIARCGTVLSQTIQDVSRGWFELGQNQWRRNIDGLQRLASARTAPEFASIQSELLRENLQHFVQDSRGIAERSLHGAEEAGKTFANAASQGGRR